MYIWIGLVFNKNDEDNIRNICRQINKEYNLSELSFTLPQHISVKTSFVSNDYIEIKDVKFNDELLTIEEDEETELQQSNHGVWNATNTDHTLPTLSIVSL